MRDRLRQTGRRARFRRAYRPRSKEYSTVKTAICEMLGIDFPLIAFSHCRDVVAAVSKAGGFGVLGAAALTPHQLELELRRIDAHIDGKRYGIDVLIPENLSIKNETGVAYGTLAERVPQKHRDFARDLMPKHGIEPSQAIEGVRTRPSDAPISMQAENALKLLEVSFRHPIGLIANALG